MIVISYFECSNKEGEALCPTTMQINTETNWLTVLDYDELGEACGGFGCSADDAGRAEFVTAIKEGFNVIDGIFYACKRIEVDGNPHVCGSLCGYYNCYYVITEPHKCYADVVNADEV